MIRVEITTTDNRAMAEDVTGIDIEELYHVVRQAVLGCGYHPDTVNDWFPMERDN